MQLYLNATSPFARLARVIALEKGLNLELCWVDPWRDDPALLAINPLGRVPALCTAQGECLTESALIALYLERQAPTPVLLPADCHVEQLSQLGIAVGLMDAAFQSVLADKHTLTSVLNERRDQAIRRSLNALSQHRLDEQQLGTLAIGVALEYLAFRLPQYSLPPALYDMQQRLRKRPSFLATAFV